MAEQEVDVAIIGAGTAGLVAYRKACEHTDNVALIDGGPLGTTCARVGCMPSKLLIAAAQAAHSSRSAALFGIHNRDTVIDGKAVLNRVRDERDRFVNSVLRALEKIPAEHKFNAFAHFEDDHTLQLSDKRKLRFKSAVIATGSRPVCPPILQSLNERLLTSDNLFDMANLPRSMAVFGPGIIGLELGQALSQLGVDIRMFGIGGGLGALQDPAVKAAAQACFEDSFYLDVDADIGSIEETSGGVNIDYDKRGHQVNETFDYVLAATGRQPNVEKLHLNNTSVKLNDQGLPIFDEFTMRCGESNVYIAGDINNDRPLLHEAADEGAIAGHNAAQTPTGIRARQRKVPLKIVFSHPQIAAVGWSLDEVKKQCGSRYAIGEVNFENQGRARVLGLNSGLLRVYGEQGSTLFLGAEMIGPKAEHIAHLLSWALQLRLTVRQILDLPFYHPVVEEGVRTALRDLSTKLKLGPQPMDERIALGPGG